MRLVFLLFLLIAESVFAQQADLRIGAIVSLGGPATEQGKNWLAGAQLAIDEARKAGTKITLVTEDDGTHPAKVVAAFKKMAAVDKVQAIIGGTWDFLAEAAYPLAQTYKIPFVTPTNPVEIIPVSAQANPWIFTTGLGLKTSEIALKALISELHPTNIAIIAPNVPFGIAHAVSVRQVAVQLAIPVSFEEHIDYAGYHETLKILAHRAKEKGVELVFCLTDYSALDIFVSELEHQKYSPWILTTQHLDQAVLYSKNPKRYAKAFGVYPTIHSADFASKFQEHYKSPPKVYAAEGYDAAKFLIAALKAKIDFQNPDSNFAVQGVTGTMRIDPNSRVLAKTQAQIMRVKEDGEMTAVTSEYLRGLLKPN